MDDLNDFMSDFMSAPMPTKPKAVPPARQGRAESPPGTGDLPTARGPYRPPGPKPVDPTAPFDAMVLFQQVTVCDHCAHAESHTSFVALRRPATGGYAYVAYNGSMSGLAHGKPRWVEYETVRQPFCAVCFDGRQEREPDLTRPGRAFFHPSRHNDNDLTLLAARLARMDFTQQIAPGEPMNGSGQVRGDAAPCDPDPSAAPSPIPCPVDSSPQSTTTPSDNNLTVPPSALLTP